MKTKILFFIGFVIIVAFSYGQKPAITLTFTADHNGEHVPLNSIFIENITQGGDTVLYSPDSALVLDYTTGTDETWTTPEQGFFVSQNFPNPVADQTTIRLFLPASDRLQFTVSDIMGRIWINRNYRLKSGYHFFTFYPGMEQLYFLSVRTNDHIRTIKIINMKIGASASETCKFEYMSQSVIIDGFKAESSLNGFDFSLGDMLKFISSSALGERVITGEPLDDQTFYFHYTGDPCPGMPTVTDIEGNIYNTVQINDQCWMKENLKTTTYNSGTAIPNVTNAIEWSNLDSGAYVWYDHDSTWKDQYGALYNWLATDDPGGLCPTGWHIPTDEEWTALTDYIGGTGIPNANKLKSCSQVNSPLGGNCTTDEHPRWDADNANGNYGTDDYGFSALPGGNRSSSGTFDDIGTRGLWWSSTEFGIYNAKHRRLRNGYGGIDIGNHDMHFGLSVRCLKN